MNPRLFTAGMLVFSFFCNVSSLSKTSCTSDDECPFGTCDHESKSCKCMLACKDFKLSDSLVCSPEGVVMPACKAVNLACENGMNIKFRLFSNQESRCENDTIKKEFCMNQTYCLNNGICYQQGSEMWCSCNRKSQGERCENNKPQTATTTPITTSLGSSANYAKPSKYIQNTPLQTSRKLSASGPNRYTFGEVVITVGSVVLLLSCVICLYTFHNTRRLPQRAEVPDEINESSSLSNKQILMMSSHQRLDNRRDEPAEDTTSSETLTRHNFWVYETVRPPCFSITIPIELMNQQN